jgi:putative transposase
MPNHVHLILTPADADGLRGDLCRSAPALHRAINARFQWTGHLFQGRFGAVVMDEPHLLAAARYIALNPVVAWSPGLVSRAEDWPWSSTRAQLSGEDDELATVAPSQALIPDFPALLAVPTDAATTTQIERAPTIGRPLGRPEWIAMLEHRLGRPLEPGKSGPKPRVERDTRIDPKGRVRISFLPIKIIVPGCSAPQELHSPTSCSASCAASASAIDCNKRSVLAGSRSK